MSGRVPITLPVPGSGRGLRWCGAEDVSLRSLAAQDDSVGFATGEWYSLMTSNVSVAVPLVHCPLIKPDENHSFSFLS